MNLKSKETMSYSSAKERDYISSLPEGIIDEIFLFLPLEDAARTSCLSKTWKQYWDSFPYYLHFDQNQSSGYQQFKRSIDKKLGIYQLKQLSILKFKLCMSTLNKESENDINRWISTVIERGVKGIDVEVGKPCRLPHSLYVAETLTVLKLKGFKMSLCHGNIYLSQLKILILENVTFLEERLIYQLLTGCSLIIEIRLIKCIGLKDLKISDLPQLKMVQIESYRRIKSAVIQVPGLEKLVISELGDLHELDREFQMNWEIDSKTCGTLRELTILCSNMMSRTFNSLVSQCSNLKSLAIEDCGKFVSLKISSQKLRRLVIKRCTRVVFADIEVPNLASFKYVTGRSPNNFLDISHLQEYVLDHSELHRGCNEVIDCWFKELEKFENKFHRVKGQKLVIFPKGSEHFDAIVLEDWTSVPELLFENVKSVEPKRLIITNISFTDLLGYMFGSRSYCHWRKLLAISSNSESKVYEVLRENPFVYPLEYCSSMALAEAEANKYFPETYWYPFSAESIDDDDYCASFYKALLAEAVTAKLKATLLFVN